MGLKLKINQKCKGEFKLIRRKGIEGPDGDMIPGPIVQETGWNRNKITLGAFNRMFNGTMAQRSGCVVGSSNTAAEETDEFLGSFIAGTTGASSAGHYNQYNSTVSPRWVRNVTSWLFGLGVAAGNIAEAGISMGGITSTHPLLCRALLVDEVGNPTVVTVLEDEFLEVIWRITWYIPEDTTNEAVLDNDGVISAVTVTCRGASIGGDGGRGKLGNWRTVPTVYDFRADTVFVSGWGTYSPFVRESNVPLNYDDGLNVDSSNYVSFTNNPYTADSKVGSIKFSLPLTRGNFASGIGGLVIAMGYGSLQFVFNPKVPKQPTQLCSFDVEITLSNVA